MHSPQPNNFIMENSRHLDVLVGKHGIEPPCLRRRRAHRTSHYCDYFPVLFLSSNSAVILDRIVCTIINAKIYFLSYISLCYGGGRSFLFIALLLSVDTQSTLGFKIGGRDTVGSVGGVMTTGRAQAHPYPHSRQICASGGRMVSPTLSLSLVSALVRFGTAVS